MRERILASRLPPDGLCLERVIIDEASVIGEAGLNKLVSWPPAH